MTRRSLITILTAALGLAVGILVVEVGLRIVGFSHPRTAQRDDFCGSARRPGIEFFHSEEGGAFVRYNSAGFRDDEWSRVKPPNTFRIAVLGDSYVEAGPVELGARFTEVFERELQRANALNGQTVHVMTFGVSGYGTAQELMALRHHVWDYAPDLVLLAVTTGNDLRNNSRALQHDEGRPYFRYVDGALTLDASFRQSDSHNPSWRKHVAFALIDWSRAAQLAFRFQQRRAGATRRAAMEEARAAVHPGREAGLDSWVYQEPTHPDQEEAWRVTEGLFSLMHREVLDRGAQFVVATLSNGIQVHPDAAVREEFMKQLGVPDLFYPEKRIAAAGARDGYPVVNLAPLLLREAQSRGVYLHGFGRAKGTGHWNLDGNREAGRLLADQVQAFLTETASLRRPISAAAARGEQ